MNEWYPNNKVEGYFYFKHSSEQASTHLHLESAGRQLGV